MVCGILEEVYKKIEKDFTSQRSTLPAMYIVTPYSNQSPVWTRQKPTAHVLVRLMQLAHAASFTVCEQLLDTKQDGDFKVGGATFG